MTWVAHFDTTKTPYVVIELYNYLDSSFMVAPAWLDVTNANPPVQTGCTYSPTTKAWTWPAVPEDLVAWDKAAIAVNQAFSALGNPTALQTEHQCQALTLQLTRILNRRMGGK